MVATGAQTLGSIDHAVRTAQRQVGEVEQRIELISQRLLGLEREEIDRFRELARIRIDLLAAGEIIDRLDQGEQATMRILEERGLAQAKLKQQILEMEARRQSLEEKRDRQARRVDEAEAQLDQRETETLKRLQVDTDYQRQLEIVRAADAVALGLVDEEHRQVAPCVGCAVGGVEVLALHSTALLQPELQRVRQGLLHLVGGHAVLPPQLVDHFPTPDDA